MNFKTFILSVLPSIVFAGFTILAPAENAVIQAGGGVYTITWQTDPGTSYSRVSIILKKDDDTVLTIAESVQNTGSYLWNPDTNLPASKDYEIEIGGGSSSAMVDFEGSPLFEIQPCSTCSAASTSLTPVSSGAIPATSAPSIATSVAISVPSSLSATTSAQATNSSTVTTGSNTTASTGAPTLRGSNSTLATANSGSGKNAIASGLLGGMLGLFVAL
ncbi:putative serine-rich protein [Neolecta irregularis DAH-3]|uniref:Putative serine-rich protein n=1 Tax=Neolecta irregularis (strain DAH-3) TaxID=1198029 RepID=A0A1U7LTD7_NEOID|nr:putative serine-rich protein [Neolecta irregularis DAH-3]|eukprot:OLL25878.1 putative serine-rich protein [Neolecta irregularis DAH-3]